MKKSYDFIHAARNPYAKRLKKQLTIRLDTDTIRYFQQLSRELALPYQTLMNMYLRDCATTGRRPEWAAKRPAAAAPARAPKARVPRKTAARRAVARRAAKGS